MKKTALIFLLALFAAISRAANPGDEVVIVYNKRVPESKSVADHYAAARHVPANQIFGLDLSTDIEMTRAEFEEKLQKPLADIFEKEKLWHIGSALIPATTNEPAHMAWIVRNSKIRYLVLCYGVPVRIAEDRFLKEPGDEKLRPELRRNTAAVDSELALLPRIEQHLPLAGPLPNWLYTSTNSAAFHPTNGLLMVARLDGPGAAIARGLVDKALEAETNGLWGRAYFDLRNIQDPGYKPGDDILRAAAEFARGWGFETIIDTNAATFPPEFPMSQIAIYAGWYADTVCGPLARPKVEFMPGAFAYHLHSFSAANLRSATQNWVGPLLAKGATISMGSVDEPYLAGTPDIGVFIARLTYFGFTFGEAAYASQSTLSWQTTVVGDPLYRPFGIPPQERHADLERRHSKLIEWSYLMVCNLNLAKGAPPGIMANFLEQIPVTKTSAVLSEKLGELYSLIGKPSSSAEMYENALKLNPSPEQKIRLRLTLAEKLTALDRSAEASDDLVKLLQENKDYPDKLGIYRQLSALAQKLHRADDVKKYDEIISQLTPPAPGK
jgi:uncharacterized protein (TIGR03790 family)